MTTPRPSAVLWLGALIVLAGAGTGVFILSRHAAWRTSTKPSPAQLTGLGGAHWVSGTEYVYSVDWQDESATNLLGVPGAGALASRVRVTGQLVLRAYESKAGKTLLSAGLGDLSEVEVDVGGARLLTTESGAASLQGARALLEVDGRGSIEKVSYESDRSGMAKYLLRGLLLHINMSIPPSFDSPVEEWGPSGRAIAKYARSPERPNVLGRTRLAYATLFAVPTEGGPPAKPTSQEGLHSLTEAGLDANGELESLDDQEQINAKGEVANALQSRSVLRMRLMERRRFEKAENPSLEQGGDLAEVVQQKISGVLLDKRIDGLTWERIETDLILHQAAGFVVDQKRWYWRATGLLEKQPELAFDLVPKFLQANAYTRAFILDLLCGAGTSQAQAAMRQALQSPQALAEPAAYAMYIQRFSFVHPPDQDSIAFVRAAYDGAAALANSSVREAIVFTLGSMAGNARKKPSAAAEGLHAFLQRGPKTTEQAPLRAAFVAALGNAEFTEDADLIRGYAADPSPQVRAHAVWALRSMSREAHVGTALSLAGDSSLLARSVALRALASRPLFESDLEKLDQITASSPPMEETYSSLLDLVVAYQSRAARRLVERVAAAPDAEERTRARAKEILREIYSDPGPPAGP